MKEDDIETFYIITERVKYHIYVKTMYDARGDIMSIGYRLAGIRKGCVNMTLFNGVLNINSIEYRERCVVMDDVNDSPLMRGDGTVHMLHTSLTYMLNAYPTLVRTITFDDASKVPCHFGDVIQNMQLMLTYIALHGQTWYQYRFGAVILNKRCREQYEERIHRLYSVEYKNSIPFSAFNVYAYNRDHLKAGTLKQLKKDYDRSRTILEFFQTLKVRYNKQFCVVTHRWLDVFIDQKILDGMVSLDTRWQIPFEHVRRIRYTVEPTDVLPTDDELKGGAATTRWKRLDEHANGHGEVSLRYGWTNLA